MKETLKLVGTLTLICLCAGTLLAYINGLTEEPIRAALYAEKMAAVTDVLPPHDNRPAEATVAIEEDGRTWTFYTARRGENYVGAAAESSSQEGYGGTITIMVGLSADGSVQGVSVLKHKETPGLGARITEPEFTGRFAGKSLTGTRWAVSKDQGEIDHITAATISSRAVVGAVKQAVDVYLKHEKVIRQGH